MSNVACQAIPVNIGGPFELRRVGVAGADVAGLQLFELLLRTEFVGLSESVSELSYLESRGIRALQRGHNLP